MAQKLGELIDEISIHALREEGDVRGSPLIASATISSARRATDTARRLKLDDIISIHALREEGDMARWVQLQSPAYFYPRPPRGGRPSSRAAATRTRTISIHALREEGDPGRFLIYFASVLFLSTPSARRATYARRRRADGYVISIHALREEGDHTPVTVRPSRLPFLSTPSARRATSNKHPNLLCAVLFLSTPSARRATCHHRYQILTTDTISIHALREEGDALLAAHSHTFYHFYPRPPRGGRRLSPPLQYTLFYFYPRPPRGGRRVKSSSTFGSVQFLSTPSARRATKHWPERPKSLSISIHALREEGDTFLPFAIQRIDGFLSTPSARRAT